MIIFLPEFELAVENNNVELVKKVLNDPFYQYAYNTFLVRAAQLGYIELVKLFLNDSRVDAGTAQSLPMRMAAKCGHLNVVKLLLEDGKSKPEDFGNDGILMALYKDHHHVVNFLFNNYKAVREGLRKSTPHKYNQLMTKYMKNKVQSF
jgi:hypothetical protein